MEIRTTEEKINELLSLYEGIRQSSVLRQEQRDLLLSPPSPEVATSETAATATEKEKETAQNVTTANDVDSLIRSLQLSETALMEFRPRMDRFRKRLKEKDPVTEKSRYGPKSQTRVQRIVELNDFLCRQYFLDSFISEQQQENQNQQSTTENTSTVTIEAGGDQNSSCNNNNNENENSIAPPQECSQPLPSPPHPQPPSEASLMFQEFQREYNMQQQEMDFKKASMERVRLEEEEKNRRKIEEEDTRRIALERQQAEELAAQEIVRKQQLHQQAEETRLRRRAQEEAQKQAERNYLESIIKGPDGVKHYLEILLQQEQDQEQEEQSQKIAALIDPSRIKALQSLCTIFEQINKHPEDLNFRKIRKNHPGFYQDIGQYKGGIELLIAAGFRPTMLPPVTSDNNNDNVDDLRNDNNATSNYDNNNNIDVINDNNNNNNTGDNEEEKEQELTIACLVSKEPHLESDMDGWMAWFDLNKQTLEILQTELQKVSSNKRHK
jgi:hypothetical protein